LNKEADRIILLLHLDILVAHSIG